MGKFLEHRIADRRVLRLIQKWLRAGVSEDGQWSKTEVGTPQGAVASPLLANVFLHYAFDLWVQQWRTKSATGDMIVVRYADDFVVGFQHRRDAERFLQELGGRMEKFGLALHPEKTRLIEFGRFAAENRRKRGEGKPETFTFLGFTHICGRKHWSGGFIVKRRTAAKRLRAKLREVRETLLRRRHEPIADLGKWLRSVMQGYFNYFGVPGNLVSLNMFRREAARSWLHALRRRSQRHRLSWERFGPIVDSLVSPGSGPAPVSERTLLRQAPEVGAVCGNSARTDLRGGTPARAFPTATQGASAASSPLQYRWSVLAQMAPYLEQANLYNALNFDFPIAYKPTGGASAFWPYYPANTTAMATQVASFLCPSDGAPAPRPTRARRIMPSARGTVPTAATRRAPTARSSSARPIRSPT